MITFTSNHRLAVHECIFFGSQNVGANGIFKNIWTNWQHLNIGRFHIKIVISCFEFLVMLNSHTSMTTTSWSRVSCLPCTGHAFNFVIVLSFPIASAVLRLSAICHLIKPVMMLFFQLMTSFFNYLHGFIIRFYFWCDLCIFEIKCSEYLHSGFSLISASFLILTKCSEFSYSTCSSLKGGD